MSNTLDAASREFAEQLTELLQGCVIDAPEFGVVEAGHQQQRRIGPMPWNSDERGFDLLPLPRACDGDGPSTLLLKIELRASITERSGFLVVQTSDYGLWVRPDPRRRPRPVFRVEYVRETRSKPSAHVHLHAESLEIGWIYGTAGLAPPRLSEFHFPVGGRRFRPTVEDLLLFLDRERLYTEWKTGWQAVVNRTLEDWEHKQASATVRDHTDVAVEQLRLMGYEVTPPA